MKEKIDKNLNPLDPSAQLLCKIGSIVVHADEMLSPAGHHFDKAALDVLLKDHEVLEWVAAMDSMALIPRKRTTPTAPGRSVGRGNTLTKEPSCP